MLVVNTMPYGDKMSAEMQRGGFAEAFGLALPHKHYYGQSLCLHPGVISDANDGSHSISRAENLKMSFKWNAPLARPVQFYLYAENKNVIRVKRGNLGSKLGVY